MIASGPTPNNTQIILCQLELTYQFILFSYTALVLISDNFCLSLLLPPILQTSSNCHLENFCYIFCKYNDVRGNFNLYFYNTCKIIFIFLIIWIGLYSIYWCNSISNLRCSTWSWLQKSMGPTYDRVTWHWLP